MRIVFNRYKVLLAIGLSTATIAVIMFFFYRYGHYSFLPKKNKMHFAIPTETIKKVVLKNGMTVLVFPLKASPKVLVQVAYNVGSGVEESGERGMAHLVEHMIFKGTQKLAEGDIDKIAGKYGASYNAETSKDTTCYYFETDKNNWKPFVEILADCMQNARFDEQHLASEVKAVIQELKMYRDDYWDLMMQKMNALLFPSYHPYHHPIIGYREDLMHASSERLKEFYRKYYRPEKATLFVIGDIDVNEVINEAEKQFDGITSNFNNEVAHKNISVPYELINHHTSFYEQVRSDMLSFYWRIPAVTEKSEIIASAAAFLLASGEGSRLYHLLVDEKQVAASVNVMTEKGLAGGIFSIFIEPMEGKIEECRKLVVDALHKSVQEGFSEQELEHMVKMHGKHLLQQLQSFDSLAQEWALFYFATGDEYALFNRINKFADIDSAEIQEFISNHLDPLLMNQMQVVPIPENKADLIEKAQEKAQELDQKILNTFVRTTPLEEARYVNNMPEPRMLDFSFPKPTCTKLANGLTVLYKENRSLPLISVNIKFRDYFDLAGSKEGLLVDLMMRSLMEGCDGFNKKELVDFFQFNGVDIDFNQAGIRLSCLAVDLDLILERLKLVITTPKFQESAVNKIKSMTVDALKKDRDDAFEVAIRELKKSLYRNHPYGWDFQEAIDLLSKTGSVDLKQLHKRYVNPENMVMSFVGDFEIKKMEALVSTIFGSWKGHKDIAKSFPPIIHGSPQQIEKKLSRDQLVLVFGKLSDITVNHPDLIPLKILSNIAFDDGSSRLFQLRERTGLFYSAFGGLAVGTGIRPGMEIIGVIVNPENAPQAEQEIQVLLHRLAEDGVTQEELNAARNGYIKALVDFVSTNASLADIFSMLEAFSLEGKFDYYDKCLEQIQGVTKESLHELAKKYLSLDKMTRVKVGRI